MSKYTVKMTTLFRKDYKRIKKRNYDLSLLEKVVDKLQSGEELPECNKDHALSGNWKGYRECHILPDWLLIYKVYENTLTLTLTRTGTHSDVEF